MTMRSPEEIVREELDWGRRHIDDPGPTPEEVVEAVRTAQAEGFFSGRAEGHRAGLEEALRIIPHHYECDDAWYSCPLSEEGTSNRDTDPDKCNCYVGNVTAAIQKLQGPRS